MKSADLLAMLKEELEPLGMEVYLFKLSWYNDMVTPTFRFQLQDDTICAVVITTPSFFEKAFLPYVDTIELSRLVKDPIDSCISYHIDKTKEKVHSIASSEITVMCDYELLPNRRPKVLVQTAAHVAGAAFYYQRKHVISENLNKTCNTAVSNNHDGEQEIGEKNDNSADDPWGEKRKIYGVCIHSKFGGWMAIRCVLIFHDFQDSDLLPISPHDCVSTRQARIDLLERFNGNWRDWSYRDVIPVEDKYSELQKQYFATNPKDRIKLLHQYKCRSNEV